MPSPKMKTSVYFEIDDLQVSARCIVSAIKTAWLRSGNLLKEISDLTIYIKAEDKKAYFVSKSSDMSGYVILTNAEDLSCNVVFKED